MKNKIQSLDSLEKIVIKEKRKKKKIVLCHGVFDLLHVGHIKHFEESKKQGDLLIVSITTDAYVSKGPNRPAFNEKLRLEALAALEVIDYIVLSNFPTAIQVIKKIKPNIYCKGPDYKKLSEDISGEIKNEKKIIEKLGGKIFFTKDITFSSSKLINKFASIHSDNQKTLINKIKKNYDFVEIKKNIEKFKKMKVLVIGEIIIDQYFFCEALGKSGKEAMLVLKDIKNESYVGGSGAICRHLSQFCNQISLISMLGEKGEKLKEIKDSFRKNIDFKFIKKKIHPQ